MGIVRVIPNGSKRGKISLSITCATVADRLRDAVAALATGHTPPPGARQELALPGQPLPRAALEALVALQADPVRYESFLQKLAAGLALTRLTWDVQELHSQLAGATAVNQKLTEEERHVLQQRLAGLQQELARVVQQKEVAERHMLPVLEALLAEYAATQGLWCMNRPTDLDAS